MIHKKEILTTILLCLLIHASNPVYEGVAIYQNGELVTIYGLDKLKEIGCIDSSNINSFESDSSINKCAKKEYLKVICNNDICSSDSIESKTSWLLISN